jgi:thioredoxin-like negative regulator of GroEL
MKFNLKLNVVNFILGVFLAGSTVASLTSAQAAQLRSGRALTTEVEKNVFTAMLDKGFHFNDKAPNSVRLDSRVVKPSKLTQHDIQFELGSKAFKSGQATLYVCDDNVTFCETHTVDIKGTGLVSKKAELRGTDYNATLEKAQNLKKPLFLEFSARWCPGCVRYEKEIFSTKDFKDLEAGLLFLKVDVDLFENADLLKKYKIEGIPTIIAVAPNEQEIDRLVDYQPWTKLKTFLKSISDDPTPAVARADAAIKNNSDAKGRLKAAKQLYATGHFDESLALLSAMNPQPAIFWTVKAAQASENSKSHKISNEEYVKILKDAIASEPNGNRSLAWRTELIPLVDPVDAKAILEAGKKTVESILSSPANLKAAFVNDEVGEFLGFEKMLVSEEWVDLLDSAKANEQEIQKAWDQAVNISESYKISPRNAGPGLRYLIFLSAAKQYPKAEAWADELLKQNPRNLDVLRRKMKILNAQGKNPEAIKIGERIITESEGRNQFWVAELLAKSYLATNKHQEAKKLLSAFLTRKELENENMKSVKQSFEDMFKQVK